jgi:PAS domain S-box-containing protein
LGTEVTGKRSSLRCGSPTAGHWNSLPETNPVNSADLTNTGNPASQRSDAPARAEIASLRRRLEFQQLLAEISALFINLPVEDVDGHINWALGRVGSFLGFNLVAITKFLGQSSAGEITHVWTAQGLAPVRPGFTELDFPWVAEQLTQNHPVHLTSLDDLPQPHGLRDRQTFEQLGIQSAYNWPLKVGRTVVGNLGFASIGGVHSFPVEFEEELDLLAQIMASTLARQRSEQAVRESEEQLSLAADAAGAGLWKLDLATDCFWLTRKTRELFGFTADELVTFDRFLGVVHPDDRELIRQTVQAMVPAKSERQVEYRIVRSDGSQRWMLSLGRAHRGKSGQPETLTGISVDITPRKEAERAHRDNEARLAAAIEVAALGFYDMSPEPKIGFVDARLRALLGLPDEERHRVLEFWREHLHPEDRPRIMELSQQAWRGELGGVAMEYRYLHPQRGTIWLSHISRVQEQTADGRVIRRLGVIRDITEQRHAELEANELRGALAHSSRVTVLGQLVSALAHELSQPLGAILRNAEAAELMLQEPSPDLEELRAIVADILKDDQRAGKVIDRLRSLLKRRTVDMQPLDLAEVIGEVLALLHGDAVARHVTLVYSPSRELPRVRGDRIQLQQVLLNLLLNGMDALTETPLEDRRIRVSAQAGASGLVEVQVRDHGPGLAGESAERLFEPFFTTKTNGMGMGLPVSQTIIEAHRGKIWANNHPEGGACFCFTLPACEGGR